MMGHSVKVDPLIALENRRIPLDQPSYKQDRTLTIRPNQVAKLTAQRNPNAHVFVAFQVFFQNCEPSVMLRWISAKQSISQRRKGTVVSVREHPPAAPEKDTATSLFFGLLVSADVDPIAVVDGRW